MQVTEPVLRPLAVTPPVLAAPLEIEYANGNRLRIPSGEGFSPALVTQLLQVTT